MILELDPKLAGGKFRRVGAECACTCRINIFLDVKGKQHSSKLQTTLYSETLSMFITLLVPRAVRLCCRSNYVTTIAVLPSRHAASSRTYNNVASVWHLRERPARTARGFSRQTLFSRARRRFSTCPVAMHGHLTPPKPGEE